MTLLKAICCIETVRRANRFIWLFYTLSLILITLGYWFKNTAPIMGLYLCLLSIIFYIYDVRWAFSQGNFTPSCKIFLFPLKMYYCEIYKSLKRQYMRNLNIHFNDKKLRFYHCRLNVHLTVTKIKNFSDYSNHPLVIANFVENTKYNSKIVSTKRHITNTICVICLEDTKGSTFYTMAKCPCPIVLHKYCITLWFLTDNAKTCPYCRKRNNEIGKVPQKLLIQT